MTSFTIWKATLLFFLDYIYLKDAIIFHLEGHFTLLSRLHISQRCVLLVGKLTLSIDTFIPIRHRVYHHTCTYDTFILMYLSCVWARLDKTFRTHACGAHMEPHLGMGSEGIERCPPYLLVYGVHGLDDHPNPLVNGRQVFTNQNELHSQSNGPIHLDGWQTSGPLTTGRSLLCGPLGWANDGTDTCERMGLPSSAWVK